MAFINKQVGNQLDTYTIEYIKCRKNPLYFIYKYISIPETGGYLKLNKDNFHPKMTQVVRSLYYHNRCIFMASRQLGKALHIDTEIPLTNGRMKKMRDVTYGDELYDHLARRTRVIGVSDIMYDHECYKLTFADNTEIIADRDHLWMFYEGCGDSAKSIILTSLDLYKNSCNMYLKVPKRYSVKNNCTGECVYRPHVFLKLKKIEKTDSVPVKCITVDNTEGMFLCTNRYLPTHNSTTAACILTWAINFYPGIPALILNMRQVAALNNLATIKSIHSSLPNWLKSPVKGKAEKKTYLELENESIIRSFYPASTAGPDQIGRSLTAPILFIDEVAFIRHIAQAYRAAQPVLSKAKEQAKKNNYPTFLLMASTPNGTAGDGKFFSDMWSNAIDGEDVFDENNNVIDANKHLIDNPDKNGFIRVKYHWSEDETKSDNWYVEQKRELNFDSRSINQELDLLFIGSTHCIFEDDFLSKLSVKKPVEKIKLSHFSNLNLYEPLDKTKHYIIGVDTAKSLTGDYCAIEIYDIHEFRQVGEFFNKLGSLTKFSEIVKEVVKYVAINSGHVYAAIENNSIGSVIIEFLENDDEYDYTNHFFNSNQTDPYKLGLNTNVKTKNEMTSLFYDYVNKDPTLIKSTNLIDQLSVIEKRANGSVGAKGGHHDDLFMASCFCAYVRSKVLNNFLLFNTENPKELELDNLLDASIQSDRNSNNIVHENIFFSERELIKRAENEYSDFII